MQRGALQLGAHEPVVAATSPVSPRKSELATRSVGSCVRTADMCAGAFEDPKGWNAAYGVRREWPRQDVKEAGFVSAQDSHPRSVDAGMA